jgi:hypothetical protein
LYHDACWTYNGGRCAVYGCSRAHAERDPLPSLKVTGWKDDGEIAPSPLPDVERPTLTVFGPQRMTGRQITIFTVVAMVMVVLITIFQAIVTR